MITILNDRQLRAAKLAFSARNIAKAAIKGLADMSIKPRAGDVVLARVAELGRLDRLELPTGRKSRLYEGDEIVVVYGNRYAPDAYEALLPPSLGACHLAAAGGLAGIVVNTNSQFADEHQPPTTLVPLGLCVDHDGHVINLAQHRLPEGLLPIHQAPVIGVFGASMNSGKTTTAAGIIKGLTAQGLTVGAAKITGTCAGGDLWNFLDAGAIKALDFTDAGMATTYRTELATIKAGTHHLLASLNQEACDVIVIELADGLLQTETGSLLQDAEMQRLVDFWVYAADSATGVAVGAERARSLGLRVAAISGAVTASPLAMREAAALSREPIVTLDELEEGSVCKMWLDDPLIGHDMAQPVTRQLSTLPS